MICDGGRIQYGCFGITSALALVEAEVLLSERLGRLGGTPTTQPPDIIALKRLDSAKQQHSDQKLMPIYLGFPVRFVDFQV